MTPPRRNIELKLRCDDLERVRRRALELGAADKGVLEQTDTYFHVPSGRLKLRQTNDLPAELIWYHREDRPEARNSDYLITRIDDPVALKELLARALGIRAQVSKRRQLLLWRNVRIHLDEVENLGRFVEFEAVIGPEADEQTSSANLTELMKALQIEGTPVPQSYCDLIA